MNRAVAFLSGLPDVVAQHWALEVTEIELLAGGMNSSTAMIRTPLGPLVAKWVPADGRAGLIHGAEAARVMQARGIRAGAPVVTTSGTVTAPALDGELALLGHVPGVPLSTSPSDQWEWGSALARVHSAAPYPAGSGFRERLLGNLVVSPADAWVRQASESVWSEYDRLPPLSWALLHTDPEPEAFLRDAEGDVGIVDWSGSTAGPVLYDVASAVMYAGGRSSAGPLLAAYAAANVVPADELRQHLPALERVRAIVQATYFSHRVHEGDLTGIASEDDNIRGLDDARRMLRGLGVEIA